MRLAKQSRAANGKQGRPPLEEMEKGGFQLSGEKIQPEADEQDAGEYRSGFHDRRVLRFPFGHVYDRMITVYSLA
ncbi:hypothetical protein JCM12214_14990 [Geobacillus vulcani]